MGHDIHHCGCAEHNAISTEDLTVKLHGVEILSNVSVSIPRGLSSAIVGPNGAGKSTLIRAILGEVPYTGSVTFGQVDGTYGPWPPRWGYVPQKLNFDRDMPLTVLEFLTSGLRRRPLFWGVSRLFRRRVEGMLAEVECLHVIDRQLGELSGGELQRVLLAQALMQKPEIMVLDEPAAGMDFQGEKLCCELLEKFRKRLGFTQLMITHDLNTVAAHAAHVICLNHEVLAAGAPQEVLTPEILHKAFGVHASLPVLHHHHHDGEDCSCSRNS